MTAAMPVGSILPDPATPFGARVARRLREDIVVFTGTARVASGEPPADQNPQYLEKYRDSIKQAVGSLQEFAAQYSVPVRVTPERVRGY
jgi:hypothetical protein